MASEHLKLATKEHLPIILTIEEDSSVPNAFCAMQVYLALSSKSAPLIMRVWSSVMDNLSPSIICWPSFFQATDGVGTPLAGHLMVMVVFEAAVTLSPTFIVTGLPSPTGISFPDSGTLIAGLAGSFGIIRL